MLDSVSTSNNWGLGGEFLVFLCLDFLLAVKESDILSVEKLTVSILDAFIGN